MKNLKKIIFCLAALILLAGCSKSESANKENNTEDKNDKLKVYASVYPMYDFANKIAGDKMDVQLIVPQGVEPHEWEPDQDTIKNLEDADIFIYNGAGLESWTDKIINSLDNKNLVTLEASEGLEILKSNHSHEEEHEDEEEHEHNHTGLDPHVWLSPINAKKELQNIKNTFVKVDPENKDYYENNYKEYSKKFDELDKKYRENLSNLKDNKIVVSHEAYGYLCKEYGLEQMGLQGVNAQTEPDAKKMAEIIDFIRNENVNTIFTEELIDSKVSEVIASETGAEVKVLSPVEGLSQEEIDNNEDYLSIMQTNLDNLVGALK